MQITLALWFFSAETPELGRVAFSSPWSGPLLSTRGTQITAPSTAITGTFPWTKAVRGLSLLALRTYLYKLNPTNPPLIIGSRGSFAVALDSAIAKEPQWLFDMLGADSDGRSAARRILKRDNPECKRPGPVTISFGTQFIRDTTIQIFLDGTQVADSEVSSLMSALAEGDEATEEGGTEFFIRQRSTAVAIPPVTFDTTRHSQHDHSTSSRLSSNPFTQSNNSTLHPLSVRSPACLSADAQPQSPVVIADSDLLVIKSVSVAWRLEEILGASGIPCRRVTWSWSEDLLEAMRDGLVDIAIYNTRSTHRFIQRNTPSPISVLSEWGNSMGGKNFYILARKDSSWACAGLDSFQRRIRKGATIIIPERSDMIANVLTVLNTTEERLSDLGIEVVSVPVSQGLEALDVNPEALLIHGQNVRFKARFRGLYNEILNFDSLSSDMQQALLNNSSNSLLVSTSCLERHPRSTLLDAIDTARQEFFTSWTNSERYPQLVKELVENERKFGIINENEITYVVKQILYETYRFGKPGA